MQTDTRTLPVGSMGTADVFVFVTAPRKYAEDREAARKEQETEFATSLDMRTSVLTSIRTEEKKGMGRMHPGKLPIA